MKRWKISKAFSIFFVVAETPERVPISLIFIAIESRLSKMKAKHIATLMEHGFFLEEMMGVEVYVCGSKRR